MKRTMALLALMAVLTACEAPLALTGLPAGTSLQAADVAARGGLPADIAARPSVQLLKPKAFALTAEAQPYLQALDRSVGPQRLQLAQDLLADPVVSPGLSQWERASATLKLETLRRVAALTGDAMGCRVPPIVLIEGRPEGGTLAYFHPGTDGLGQIVLYPEAMASGGKYLILSTLVHEIRHAAQYQLMQGDVAAAGLGDSDVETLTEAYENAWQMMAEVGGQSTMTYGDYVHLNMEFDAFQTGNAVAAIVSRGDFSPVGYGFVDTYFQADAVPVLNLIDLMGRLSGYELIAEVNRAQAQAERTYGGRVTRWRAPGFSLPGRNTGGGFGGRFPRR